MAFRINHAKVISQANSIADDASQISAQVKLLSQLEQDIRSAWKGEAATAFLSRLTMLKNNVKNTGQQMAKLSSTIKYCADRIQREDEEANRRAAALKSIK